MALVVISTNDLDLLEGSPEKLVPAVDTARDGSYEFVRNVLPPKRVPREWSF